MIDDRYRASQAALNRALLVLKACEPSRLKRKLRAAWVESVRDMAVAIVELQSIRSDQLLQHHTLECYVEAIMNVGADDLEAADNHVRNSACRSARDSSEYQLLMNVSEMLRAIRALDPPRTGEFPPLPKVEPDIAYRGQALIERRHR